MADKNNLNQRDRVVLRKVDSFCERCNYLDPDAEDPCKGCKMQEFVDSLYGKKCEEPREKTYRVTISEHRELEITVAAKNRHDAEEIAELVSDMGLIDTLDGDITWGYKAEEIEIPAAKAEFSQKDVE